MNKSDETIVNGLRLEARRYQLITLTDEIEAKADIITEIQDRTGMLIDKIPAHVETLERALRDIGLGHWIQGQYSLAEMHTVREAILRAFVLPK